MMNLINQDLHLDKKDNTYWGNIVFQKGKKERVVIWGITEQYLDRLHSDPERPSWFKIDRSDTLIYHVLGHIKKYREEEPKVPPYEPEYTPNGIEIYFEPCCKGDDRKFITYLRQKSILNMKAG